MSAPVTQIPPLPYVLREYIKEAQNYKVEIDGCDHRGTTQATLDKIHEDAIRDYSAGQALMDEIHEKDAENLNHCRLLCEIRVRRNDSPTDLIKAYVLGKWVLVPRYVTFISDVLKLREVIR